MRDSTSLPAFVIRAAEDDIGVEQLFGGGFERYFGLRGLHFGVGSDSTHVAGNDVHFRLSYVLREGTVYACEVRC